MILKTIEKEQDHFIIKHIGNVKSIMHERKNNMSNDYLEISYNNGNQELLNMSELSESENSYKDLFSEVYLLNDEGKTIEKIF